MADAPSYIYVRLSADARHSRIGMAAALVEGVLGSVALEADLRDQAVYFFSLPPDFADGQARQLVSTLATEPYIEEVWRKEDAPRMC